MLLVSQRASDVINNNSAVSVWGTFLQVSQRNLHKQKLGTCIYADCTYKYYGVYWVMLKLDKVSFSVYIIKYQQIT